MRVLQPIYATVVGTSHHPGADNLKPMDICDQKQVSDLFHRIRPHLVFNFAAISDVTVCEQYAERALATNYQGVCNLANVCRSHGTRLVHVSTDYVFDGERQEYSEDDEPNPLQVYGRTKWMSEIPVLENNGLVIRSSGVIGYAGKQDSKFMRKFINGGPQTMVNNQKKRFMFADDLVVAMTELAQKDCSGIYHVAGSKNLSWFEYASIIADVLEESVLSKIPDRPSLCLMSGVPQTHPTSGAVIQRPEHVSLKMEKAKAVLDNFLLTSPQDAARIMGEQIRRDYELF